MPCPNSIVPAALALLFACSPADTTGLPESPPGWPKSFATPGGDELELAAPPQRIVVANAGAAEFVLALVEGERIAAIPEPAFTYSYAPPSKEEFGPERRFRKYLGEEMLAFDPDLVITHDWQSPETSSVLMGAGIPVLALPEVHETGDIEVIFELLGGVLDAEESAAAIVAELRARIEALSEQPAPDASALSFSSLGDDFWVAGADTTADLIFELAGVRNAAQALSGHRELDIERLFTLDPDFILVGSEDGEPGTSELALRNHAALSQLRAVRLDRIIALPPALFTTSSHHVVEAAEELRDALVAHDG